MQKYRSNGFLSQHSVYREAQCRNDLRTRLPAPRVTEHWNDLVRNPLLRDFGTCYPVVNGLRALVASAEWNSALAIQWAPSVDATFRASSALGGQPFPPQTTGPPSPVNIVQSPYRLRSGQCAIVSWKPGKRRLKIRFLLISLSDALMPLSKDNCETVSNVGQSGPVTVKMKLDLAINLDSGEVQVNVTSDINKTGIKSSSDRAKFGRLTNRNVPQLATPPLVDLTGEKLPNVHPIRKGHQAIPWADSPPLIDLTTDEDQRHGLVSNGRTTSTDPSSEEPPAVVVLTQEEDKVVPEDILVRDVTEEEWKEAGFDRD
ncbi:hypothetical protein Bbelb_168030 [Branchiostoma belcheri]|nr:hypothetical protein Bbelb_168030 [Branchiostoma belcheri]